MIVGSTVFNNASIEPYQNLQLPANENVVDVINL